MKGFKSNIEKDTIKNRNFRKVLYTGKNSQLVLMSLKPKEDIGMEVHPDNDQFLRFEGGRGRAEIDGNKYHGKGRRRHRHPGRCQTQRHQPFGDRRTEDLYDLFPAASQRRHHP